MTPRIALLVIGDGRDDLKQDTVESWHAHATGLDLVTVVEVDDRFHRLGFCGAIRDGWTLVRAARRVSPFDFVFHLEEDWRFDREFSIAEMADVLDADTRLAQVALRRGPENEQERAAGGLVGAWPDEYQDCSLFVGGIHPLPDAPARTVHYLRHRLFFTTNPSLYRAGLLDVYEWPEAPRCEEEFSWTLRVDGFDFAFLGQRDDEPWITHTGRDQRIGTGY